MNASVQQIPNVLSPPLAQGGTAELLPGHARFENVLGAAMKKSDSLGQPELPQAPASQTPREPKPHNKSSQPAINPQTPAVVAVPANSPGKLAPVVAQGQSSGTGNASASSPQVPARGLQVLEALADRKLLPDVAEVKHTEVAATELQEQLNVPQAASQTDQNQNDLLTDATGLTKSAPFRSPYVGKGQPASASARVISSPANQLFRAPGLLFDALGPAITKPTGQLQASNAVLETTNQTMPSPTIAEIQPPPRTEALAEAQPPAQPVSEAKPPVARDKQLQRALTAMENLQLGFFSSATSQNAAPIPSGLQGAKTFSTHGKDGRTTANPVDALRQKQEAAGFQNPGKGASGSNAGTGQEPRKGFALNTTAPGSSDDSPKDAKSGQDLPTRHPEVSGSQASGTNSLPGSFSSVAVSATAASAAAVSVATIQAPPANSAPPNAGSLSQPAATHTAADKLIASVENPLNPAGGVINTASLLQTQGKTEMRVAMQTETLGPLELHAVLDGGRLGASIAVVNHEAHTLLTNNLPSLQQVLNDQNLRVDHLSVLNAATSSGTSTGNGGGFQSGGQPQSRSHAPRWVFSPPIQVAVGGKGTSVAESLRGRLSVRA